MSKIVEEEFFIDLNSENNNETDSAAQYPFKNSKSQDICIKNFNNLIMTDLDTSIKTKPKRTCLNSMFITNKNLYNEPKNFICFCGNLFHYSCLCSN